MSLGGQLYALRREKGLTLRELGDKIGIPYSHISKIEHGRASPTIDTLNRICNGIGISAWWLLLKTEQEEKMTAKQRDSFKESMDFFEDFEKAFYGE